jgi:tetratricopeptide (TPR) repeat protein
VIAAVFLALSTTSAFGGYELRLRDADGEVLCSLQAKSASVEAILKDIGERTSRTVSGLEGHGVLESVSVVLEERPLNQAITTVLGCAGLRARITSDSIDVVADLGQRATADELDDQTEVAYLRALKSFPEDAGSARAEFTLAEIQERRGNDAAALSHYETVARDSSDDALAPDALLAAGTILERMGDWHEATRPFSALANIPQFHPHQPKARLEIARCMTYTGDSRQALFMLEALEQAFPAKSPKERQARLYVRARALNGTDQHGAALRALESAEALGADPSENAQALELRAEALEHFERPAEAARAWLSFSEHARSSDRRRALVNAARLALDAHDWIAVLMIEKLARGSGAEADIAASARAARQSLGLDEANPSGSSPETDLLRVEELFNERLFRQAAQAGEALYRTRELFDEKLFTRLVLVYSRALDADRGVDAAIGVLRAAVRSIEDVESRKAVYVLAGELYESHELFDEAIAAYGGTL